MTAGVLNMPGLPEKPKDPQGRSVFWVLLTQAPGFVYGDQRFAVDDAFIDARLKEWRTYTKNGYRPPALREHERDGERHGDVLDIRRFTIDGKPSLIGAVALADPEASDKVSRGQIKYVSPSFGPFEDDRGNKYKFALREVSLVAAPHQKHLTPGQTHVLGMETTMPEEIKEIIEEKVESGDDMKDRLEKLEAMMAELMDFKSLLEKAMAEDAEGEDVDMKGDHGADMSEVAALRAELEAIKTERDRAIWEKQTPEALAFTSELGEALFAIWRQDKDAFGAVLKEASIKKEKSTTTPRETPQNPWGARLSESGGEPKGAPATDEEMYAEALRRAKGDQRKALEEYKKMKTIH